MQRALVLVSSFAALGGFLYGYDLGLIGGAILNIRDDFNTTANEKAWIVGAAKLGAFFGTFPGGAAMHKFGRRATIAADSLFFAAGPIIMATATSVAALIIGRFVVGLGIGVSAVVVPTYLGELAPPAVRGAVVIVYEVLLCIGMLAAALVDAALQGADDDWRWMVGAPVAPGAVLVLALVLLPESPRWLVTQGDMDAALAALHRVMHSEALDSGRTSTAEVEQELMLLWSAVEKDRAERDIEHGKGSPAEGCEGMAASAARSPAASGAIILDGLSTDGSALHRHAHMSREIELPVAAALVTSPSARSDPTRQLSAAGLSPSHTDVDILDSVGSGTLCGQDHVPSAAPFIVHRTPVSPPHAMQPRAADTGYFATLAHMITDVRRVVLGRERAAVRLALALAFFNQITASTAVINYAPEVLDSVGVQQHRTAILYSSLTALAKTIGVIVGMFFIDSAGRRPLLLIGSAGCGAAMFALAAALYISSVWLTTVSMCVYILSFSMSWAGVFWVVCAELFSMRIKSTAVSVAIATLFASGALADVLFPLMVQHLGGGAFVVFGTLSLLAGVYVYFQLPETKGKTLLEVQALLQKSR